MISERGLVVKTKKEVLIVIKSRKGEQVNYSFAVALPLQYYTSYINIYTYIYI